MPTKILPQNLCQPTINPSPPKKERRRQIKRQQQERHNNMTKFTKYNKIQTNAGSQCNVHSSYENNIWTMIT